MKLVRGLGQRKPSCGLDDSRSVPEIDDAYKPVSVRLLVELKDGILHGKEARGVNLCTFKESFFDEEVGILEKGCTGQIISKDEAETVVFVPFRGEVVLSNSLVEAKARADWELSDVTTFLSSSDFYKRLCEKNPKVVSKPFKGVYVTCAGSAKFCDFVQVISKYYSNMFLKSHHVWLDLFGSPRDCQRICSAGPKRVMGESFIRRKLSGTRVVRSASVPSLLLRCDNKRVVAFTETLYRFDKCLVFSEHKKGPGMKSDWFLWEIKQGAETKLSCTSLKGHGRSLSRDKAFEEVALAHNLAQWIDVDMKDVNFHNLALCMVKTHVVATLQDFLNSKKSENLNAVELYSVADVLRRSSAYEDSVSGYLRAQEQMAFQGGEDYRSTKLGLAQANISLSNWDIALEDLETTLELEGQPDNVFEAKMRFYMAICLAEKKELTRAMKELKLAENLLANSDKMLQDIAKVEIKILNCQGVVYQTLENFKKAAELQEICLKRSKILLGKHHVGLAKCLNNLGIAHYSLGNRMEAFRFFKETIRILRRWHKTNSIDLSDAYWGTAMIYLDTGDLQLAMDKFRSALAIKRDNLGEDHPEVASILVNIANVQSELHDYDNAITLCNKAIDMKTAAYGSDDISVAQTLDCLGACLTEKEEYDKALKAYRRALEIRSTVAPDRGANIFTLNDIGGVLFAQGKYADAVKVFQETIQLVEEEKNGEQDMVLVDTLNNIALCYEQLNDNARALDFHQRVLEISERVFGSDNPQTLETRENITRLSAIPSQCEIEGNNRPLVESPSQTESKQAKTEGKVQYDYGQ